VLLLWKDRSVSEPTREQIHHAPKVLLHDHLDGGLRPQTVLELAEQVGHPLPAADAESLAHWFAESADSGSLVRYLETFDHTVGVMQTEEALERVARECVADLAADGVVYAEVRYAPEQHVSHGLTLDRVVGAVRYRDQGVAGFDIAGAEAGFPPTRHLDAFEYLRRENAHFTIHAGEAFGLPSIWEAIQWCGADRLGHGVRIVDDITVGDKAFGDDVAAAVAADTDDVHLGRLAAYVRDTRIPLEMCPSSNVQTGAAESVALHPISLLKRLRFRVTVNHRRSGQP